MVPELCGTGFQARSRGGRWSWTFKLAQMRDHEQGGGTRLRKLDFFRFGLFLNISATDIVLVIAKGKLRSALVAAQWRGDTALTLALFLRRSTAFPVFFGWYPRSSLHSFGPVPNKPSRFCGRKATRSRS